MNRRMILYLVGQILRIEALFMLPALAISLYLREQSAIVGLGVSIALTLAAGLLALLAKPRDKSFHAKEGFVIVGLAWIVVSLFGALPFFLSGEIPDFMGSLFEAVSGFTTTGASVLANVEAMPKGLVYWRSFTHWLGGMGVLVFLLAIVPLSRGTGNAIFLLRAESTGPQVDKLVPRMRRTAEILYAIYVGMTLLQIVLMLAGGVPLFDSITLTFGTAGTGGFAIKNTSMADYSAYAQVVVTVFMALFGVSFNIYYLLLIRSFRTAFKNEELYTYFGIMALFTLFITLDIRPLFAHGGEALRHAAFQVSSIMTTTGFSTADFNLWPQFSRMLLVVLMVLGACAGSTGGGIKIARVLILLKAARNAVSQAVKPNTVRLTRLNGNALDQDTIHGTHVFMTLYAVIAVTSMLALSFNGFSVDTNATAVLACLNNIGPGLDDVGPMGNYGAFSPLGKLILIFNMLIGRLEIIPMFTLFAPSVWKR
ncbi:MAG: TrkH family potassium uptake protein [Candidatus Limiplasma sp.]|nr:TrkH family potassium uptake protein [Candidatus Limiplasma sp.]